MYTSKTTRHSAKADPLPNFIPNKTPRSSDTGLNLTQASHVTVFLYTAPIFAALGLQARLPAERLARLAPVLHGFTHSRLRILPMRVAGVRPRDAVGDNPGLRWASRAELQAIGLPAPVRRLLEDG